MPIKHDPKTGRILPALTPEQKVQAKVMIGQGIKGKVVARELGVDPSTISRTVVPAWLSPDALQAEKIEFDLRASGLVDKAMRRMDEALDRDDHNAFSKYSVPFGILYDKRALNRGQPTVITSGLEALSDEELKEGLAGFGLVAIDITKEG